MFIPGSLISILTFPGVIVHEAAHRFFCDLAKVPVYEVCYFRFGNPAGYVIHEETDCLKSSFLISVGPLLINSLLSAALGFTAVFPILILREKHYNLVFLLLLWIAVSIGMHAFPSNQDMSNFLDLVKKKKGRSVLLVVSWLFAGLFKIANLLRFFWFDAVYAAGVIMLMPKLLGFI